MRGLAEFVMRGRWQALAVAILGSGSLLFGWISAAAVALVTLRKGVQEGGWLVFWALLPASVLAWMSGDAGGLLLLAGVYILAAILRESVSLPLAILATIPLGLLSGGFLLLATGAFLDVLVAWYTDFIEQLSRSLSEAEGTEVTLVPLTATQLAGMLAAGNAGLCAVSLLLGRYWQAALYNPGGFGDEFRRLRLPPSWTFMLAALAGGMWFAGGDVSGWAVIFAVPLTLCGFALVHAWAKARGVGGATVATCYLMWIFFDPLKAVMLGLVLADAVSDFRARWATQGGDQP